MAGEGPVKEPFLASLPGKTPAARLQYEIPALPNGMYASTWNTAGRPCSASKNLYPYDGKQRGGMGGEQSGNSSSAGRLSLTHVKEIRLNRIVFFEEGIYYIALDLG